MKSGKAAERLRNEAAKLFQLGEYEQIVKLYDDLNKSDLGSLGDNNLIAIAGAMVRINQLERSIDICNEIYATQNSNSSFLQVYGTALRLSGRVEEATETLRKGMEEMPNDSFIINNYANCLIDLQRTEEAVKILQELVNKTPLPLNINDIKINLRRAEVAMSSNLEINKNEGSKIKNIDPIERAFSKEEIGLSKQKLHDSSLDSIRKKLKGLTNETDSSRQSAYQLLKMANEASATAPINVLKDLNLVLKNLKNNFIAYEIAGDCYIALKQFADAESAYMASIMLGNKSAKAKINLANLVLLRGDKGLATEIVSMISESQLTEDATKNGYKALIQNIKTTEVNISFQIPSKTK